MKTLLKFFSAAALLLMLTLSTQVCKAQCINTFGSFAGCIATVVVTDICGIEHRMPMDLGGGSLCFAAPFSGTCMGIYGVGLDIGGITYIATPTGPLRFFGGGPVPCPGSPPIDDIVWDPTSNQLLVY